MVYDLLLELRANGKLYSCSMLVSHPGAIGGRRYVFGREITDLAGCASNSGAERADTRSSPCRWEISWR